MAYNLSQFITQALGGGAVWINNPDWHKSVVIEIGGRTIELTGRNTVKTVDGNNNIAPITLTQPDNASLDLGTLFTANQVLESYSLKKHIIDGTVVADAGTQALSRTAVE